jgi:hypothetical protein
MCVLKGADTVDEALNQFYENPNKYSHDPVPSTGKHTQETKMQVDSPPPYGPLADAARGPRRRPHTNAVIEAGNVRARDEVRFHARRSLSGDGLTVSGRIARDAEHAPERSAGVSDLQSRC